MVLVIFLLFSDFYMENYELICVRGYVNSPPPLYFFSIKIVQSKNLSTLYIFRTLYNFTLSSLYISRTLYIFEKCTEFKKCTELRVSPKIHSYISKYLNLAWCLTLRNFFLSLLKCRSLTIFYSIRSLTCSFHKKAEKPDRIDTIPFFNITVNFCVKN